MEGHIFGILRYFDDEKSLVYRVPMLIAICPFFCFKRKKKFSSTHTTTFYFSFGCNDY